MKIRIFTDLRFAATATPTGVGKHISHMAQGLATIPGNEVSLLAASDQVTNPGVLGFLPVHRMPLSWNVASALWAAGGYPCADRWCGDADWVYCPKNDWIPLRRKRLAVTIHGAHELDPAMPRTPGPLAWSYRLRNRVQYSKMCRHADVVFTVSEFLRAQVIQWFHAAPEKVVVVGNGVEQVYFDAGQKRSPGDLYLASVGLAPACNFPYALALGGLNVLDGGDHIVAVAKEIACRRLDLRIVVAGWQHDPQLESASRENPVIELLGYVPAERLATLMAGSTALIYPTRYETFGMGAAEAMASGTPVITCRNTAVPEVVGDAGIYIDPIDPGAIVDAIQSVQSDPELRARHVNRGRRRAADYTWAACVERVHRELERRM